MGKDKDFVYDEEEFKRAAKKPGKFFRKFGWMIIAAIVIMILALNSTYQINEQEQAVLVTLGKPQSVTDSGLHFKIPFIQKVIKVDTTIHGFTMGYNTDADGYVLDTDESLMITSDYNFVNVIKRVLVQIFLDTDESLMITSDYNFVNVDFFVEYKVTDPVKAVYNSQNPELILKNIAQGCIRSVVASYDVDSVLTTGKSEIQSNIKQLIVGKLEDQDIGIMLVNITIQDSEPPTVEVMEAFKAVETAKQGKETALNNANKYRNEQVPEAQAQADGIIKNAEAQKEQRINEATAQVSRFNAMYEEYEKNPTVIKLRMFYEAMEDVLPDLKVIIVGTDGVETVLPLDSFTGDSANNSGSSYESQNEN